MTTATKKEAPTFYEKVAKLNELVKDSIENQNDKSFLVQGSDYGMIKSRDTLLKPGSEKVFVYLNAVPSFERDTDSWEMAGSPDGLFAYICKAVDDSGVIRGEGRGAASQKEKSYWVSKSNFNSPIKIAEKRAMVNTALRIGALSGFFTQDLEDTPIEERSNVDTSTAHKHPKDTPLCPNCKVRMQERSGKMGKFYGCINYPKCKQTFPINIKYDLDGIIISGGEGEESINAKSDLKKATKEDSEENIPF